MARMMRWVIVSLSWPMAEWTEATTTSNSANSSSG